MQKSITLFLAMAFGIVACHSVKQSKLTNSELQFRIDFQDDFLNDTVTLQINNCQVLTKKVLISDNAIGSTGVQLLAQNKKSNIVDIFNKNDHFKCKMNSNNLKISISLNGNNLNYDVDLAKGKYLGFSKVSNEKLEFMQSSIAFSYY